MEDKELTPGKWDPISVDTLSQFLIPVPDPFGGVLIVSDEIIAYYNGGKKFKSAKVKPYQVCAWGMIDANRYLIGDHEGHLSMAILRHDAKSITSITVEPLGTITQPSTISYLDNGYVYIGTFGGDAQLIKLNSERDEAGSLIEVIDEYPCISSIVDFCVMDLDRQGQGQVVTCSGSMKDGSLRVIRNGIGINEEASIELPGMKGLWSLRASTKTEFDTYLVESFVGETRVLAMQDEQLGETNIEGLDDGVQTLYCANTPNDSFVQVTKGACRLISCETLTLTHKWEPPAGASITVASSYGGQILLALQNHSLRLLECDGKFLREVASVALPKPVDVSCIDLTPLDGARSGLAVVGMWDISVLIVELPSLRVIGREEIGGVIIPRSVKLARFVESSYLLCGLGDGQLVTYDFDRKSNTLSNSKRLNMGTQPITLSSFTTKGRNHVLAACDRPTVIYGNPRGKILYSNVNLRDVNYVAPFNAEAFPGCLAFATEATLLIGQMDDIQKLHVRTIRLNEQPRRIAHMKSSGTLLVGTIRLDAGALGGPPEEAHFLRLFDDQSFEQLASLVLEPFENVSSIACITVDGKSDYYFVGTAKAKPDEPEPTEGRVLVYRVSEKKLVQISAFLATGAIYDIVLFKGKIAISVNSKVQLLNWQPDTRKLVVEASCLVGMLSFRLSVSGEFIVVGDLQQSVHLLSYNREKKSLEVAAKDHDSVWVTALSGISSGEGGDIDVVISADHDRNLYCIGHNLKASNDEERGRLEQYGLFHIGDQVNRIRRGSLVMDLPDKESKDRIVPSHIFGTLHGQLGVIAPLSRDQYLFLLKLEEAMSSAVPGVGDLNWKEWKAFKSDRKEEPKKNFIDGDLIEMFLDLSPPRAEAVAGVVGLPLVELSAKVEELTRIH